MIKILKGSRFAVISHRFQQLIRILIWDFCIFSSTAIIISRISKSMKWKAEPRSLKKEKSWWWSWQIRERNLKLWAVSGDCTREWEWAWEIFANGKLIQVKYYCLVKRALTKQNKLLLIFFYFFIFYDIFYSITS